MSDGEDYSDSDSRESYQHSSYSNPPPPTDGQPYLEIAEQPQPRGFRFRYKCEGDSHGGLQGENSRREKKTYPSVKMCNYRGPAKLTVTLVTDELSPQPHAHDLTSKHCSEDGIYHVRLNAIDNIVVSFPNIGINHVKKKSVPAILRERLREQFKTDKMMMEGNLGQSSDLVQLTDEEENAIKKQADAQAKKMNLKVVRLCFRAYLLDQNGICTRVLPPVISNPIYDSKAPSAAPLRICRLDKVGGCCIGNEEIFMLCDKVQKEDISVRFYELDDEGQLKWEGFGEFAPQDVHRQFAIVFRTPRYQTTSIDHPVTVHLQLQRLKDGVASDSKKFTYYPQVTDREDVQRKRKKVLSSGVRGESHTAPAIPNNIDFMRILQAHSARVSAASPTARSIYPTTTRPGVPQQLQYVPVGIRQLQEDSVPVELVARGARLYEPFEVEGKAEPHIDLSKNVTQKVDHIQQESQSNNVSSTTTDHDTQTEISFDTRLLHTLAHMLERTSLSVQRYSQTGDLRHLLMPNRHLISSKNEDGDNAVHLSVIHGQSSATRNLLSVLKTLQSNAAIDDRNDLLQTPLQLALITHQTDLVELLLNHGADPRSVYDTRSGSTLLHIAARDGDHKSLKLLLNHWESHKQAAKWTPDINTHNFDGFTALHMAVLGGHLEAVQLLVQLGRADVNLGDGRCGQTALHHAVIKHNLAVLGYLILECSADVDKPDDSGNTPLHYASSSNKVDVAAVLMAAGANPDLENYNPVDSESESDDEDATDGQVNRKKQVDSEEDTVTGATPRDLAEGNSRMMRILGGEEYCSVSGSVVKAKGDAPQLSTTSIVSSSDPLLHSYIDSGFDSINFTSSGRLSSLLLSKNGGDMSRLDALVRMKLSKLLDPIQPGSDWRELTGRLKLGYIFRALELQKSPTKALLDNYELVDGMVVELRKCLLEMNRTDAVDLVDSALQ